MELHYSYMVVIFLQNQFLKILPPLCSLALAIYENFSHSDSAVHTPQSRKDLNISHTTYKQVSYLMNTFFYQVPEMPEGRSTLVTWYSAKLAENCVHQLNC